MVFYIYANYFPKNFMLPSANSTATFFLSSFKKNRTNYMEETSTILYKWVEFDKGHEELEEEEEDTISLCDLPLHDQGPNEQEEEHDHHPNSPCNEDSFEFSTSSGHKTGPRNIVFCGKIISHKAEDHSSRSSSYLLPRTTSAQFSSNSLDRCNSFRHVHTSKCADPLRAPRATQSFRYHSHPAPQPIPARSNSSRKHRVLIGLEKIPHRMELSDIKRRQQQSRLAPPPMIPAGAMVVHGKEPVAAAGGSSAGKGGSHWNLLRRLRFRSYLAYAFGCISLV